MGEILNIRVMAQTLDEEDVAGAWPGLCALVWPDWSGRLKLKNLRLEKLLGSGLSPAPVAPAAPVAPVEKALGRRTHGVVELAQGLDDWLRFVRRPEVLAVALEGAGQQVAAVAGDLAAALENWDARQASSLTNVLERALDQAERALGSAAV